MFPGSSVIKFEYPDRTMYIRCSCSHFKTT